MASKNPFFDDRSDSERTRQALTSAKIKKIKEATGSKCEMCGKKYPLRNLKVHHIVEVHKAAGVKDLNSPSNLLVLCSICHDDVHHKPVPKSKQKEFIKKRSEKVKKDIQGILRNRQKINDSSTDISSIKPIKQVKFDSIRIDTPDFFGAGSSKKKGKKKDEWDFF